MFRRVLVPGCFAAAFMLAAPFAARADEPHALVPVPSAPEFALQKGLVGNALELLPLDADVRVELQRVNAVVSGPMTARSIATLLGVANPVFMVPGLIWGIWSAFNIQAPKADPRWLLSSRPSPHRVGFCTRAAAACGLHTAGLTSGAQTAEVKMDSGARRDDGGESALRQSDGGDSPPRQADGGDSAGRQDDAQPSDRLVTAEPHAVSVSN